VSSKFGQDLDMIISSRCTVPHLASVHSLHWFVPGTKRDHFQVILSLSERGCPWLITSNWWIFYNCVTRWTHAFVAQ
jgi:hypothetical protein